MIIRELCMGLGYFFLVYKEIDRMGERVSESFGVERIRLIGN